MRNECKNPRKRLRYNLSLTDKIISVKVITGPIFMHSPCSYPRLLGSDHVAVIATSPMREAVDSIISTIQVAFFPKTLQFVLRFAHK